MEFVTWDDFLSHLPVDDIAGPWNTARNHLSVLHVCKLHVFISHHVTSVVYKAVDMNQYLEYVSSLCRHDFSTDTYSASTRHSILWNLFDHYLWNRPFGTSLSLLCSLSLKNKPIFLNAKFKNSLSFRVKSTLHNKNGSKATPNWHKKYKKQKNYILLLYIEAFPPQGINIMQNPRHASCLTQLYTPKVELLYIEWKHIKESIISLVKHVCCNVCGLKVSFPRGCNEHKQIIWCRVTNTLRRP